MRISGVVDVDVEVASQYDVTAVDGESLEHGRQFNEELTADWLAARTVDDDDDRDARVSRRQKRCDILERRRREVEYQSLGLEIVPMDEHDAAT
jgi:hypothetical protein